MEKLCFSQPRLLSSPPSCLCLLLCLPWDQAPLSPSRPPLGADIAFPGSSASCLACLSLAPECVKGLFPPHMNLSSSRSCSIPGSLFLLTSFSPVPGTSSSRPIPPPPHPMLSSGSGRARGGGGEGGLCDQAVTAPQSSTLAVIGQFLS